MLIFIMVLMESTTQAYDTPPSNEIPTISEAAQFSGTNSPHRFAPIQPQERDPLSRYPHGLPERPFEFLMQQHPNSCLSVSSDPSGSRSHTPQPRPFSQPTATLIQDMELSRQIGELTPQGSTGEFFTGCIPSELVESLEMEAAKLQDDVIAIPEADSLGSETALPTECRNNVKENGSNEKVEDPSWIDDMRRYASSLRPVDCVILMEECRPFNSKTDFMISFKETYLKPILKHLNGGPETNTDFGCDVYTSLYSLATFPVLASGSTQRISSSIGPFTPMIYRVSKEIDDLFHQPTFSPSRRVPVTGLLDTALTLFQAIDEYRDKAYCRPVRHLILLVVSDIDISIPPEDETKYKTSLNSVRSQNIHCSLFSPRQSDTYRPFSESVNGCSDMNTGEITNERRQMALSCRESASPRWPTALLCGLTPVVDPSGPLPGVERGEYPRVRGDSNGAGKVGPQEEQGQQQPYQSGDTGLMRTSSLPNTSDQGMDQAPPSVQSDHAVHTPQSYIAASPVQPNTPLTESQSLPVHPLHSTAPLTHSQMAQQHHSIAMAGGHGMQVHGMHPQQVHMMNQQHSMQGDPNLRGSSPAGNFQTRGGPPGSHQPPMTSLHAQSHSLSTPSMPRSYSSPSHLVQGPPTLPLSTTGSTPASSYPVSYQPNMMPQQAGLPGNQTRTMGGHMQHGQQPVPSQPSNMLRGGMPMMSGGQGGMHMMQGNNSMMVGSQANSQMVPGGQMTSHMMSAQGNAQMMQPGMGGVPMMSGAVTKVRRQVPRTYSSPIPPGDHQHQDGVVEEVPVVRHSIFNGQMILAKDKQPCRINLTYDGPQDAKLPLFHDWKGNSSLILKRMERNSPVIAHHINPHASTICTMEVGSEADHMLITQMLSQQPFTVGLLTPVVPQPGIQVRCAVVVASKMLQVYIPLNQEQFLQELRSSQHAAQQSQHHQQQHQNFQSVPQTSRPMAAGSQSNYYQQQSHMVINQQSQQQQQQQNAQQMYTDVHRTFHPGDPQQHGQRGPQPSPYTSQRIMPQESHHHMMGSRHGFTAPVQTFVNQRNQQGQLVEMMEYSGQQQQVNYDTSGSGGMQNYQ